VNPVGGGLACRVDDRDHHGPDDNRIENDPA
jgi:hypothetical protein